MNFAHDSASTLRYLPSGSRRDLRQRAAVLDDQTGNHMGSKKTAQPRTGGRRQWGSDRRDQPLPMVAPPVSDLRITHGTDGDRPDGLGMVHLRGPHDHPAVRRGPRRRAHGSSSRRSSTSSSSRRSPPRRWRTSSPASGSSTAAASHRRAPRAAIDDFFDAVGPDGDRAGALVPGGRARHPHHPAVGGPAGAPVPARRAADRRPAQPQVGARPPSCSRQPAPSRPRSKRSSPCR